MIGNSTIFKRRLGRKIFKTSALSIVFVLGAGNTSAAWALDDVTLGLATPPTVNVAFYAFGKDLGVFKNEDINLNIVVLKGAGQVVPQVATKHILIGQPLPDTVIAAFADNRPVPLTFFYNGLPKTTMQLGVLANSSIRKVVDLKGKSIGVGALTWGTIPGLKAMLRHVGLVPGKDVHIAAVGILGSGFHSLKSGDVAALNYNSAWLDLLELRGTKVRRLPLPKFFSHMIANAYVTNSETFEQNPHVFARFGRAITKAMIACDANPEACVKSFWRHNPEANSKTGDEEKNLRNAVWLLNRRLNMILWNKPYGHFDLNAIKEYVDVLRKEDVIHSADVPIKRLFSNSLVAEFNSFDPDQIREKARNAE
jgi:NitT/TauT family transport system substrate-binding protein